MKSIVLITGASSGIGKEIAFMLHHAGHIVYGTSRNPELCDLPYHMLYMDVTDPQSIKKAIDTILEQNGQINVLINNAGIGIAGPVEETHMDEFQKQFDINFFGCIHLIQTVLPHMISLKNGTIINISSIAGFIPIPFQSAYSSSKAALDSLTLALRSEVKPYGVNVILVQPGDTKTSFTNNRIFAQKTTESSRYKETFLNSINRMAKDEKNGLPPEKVAKSIVKLLNKKNPPVSVKIGFQYKLIGLLYKILPQKLVHSIVEKMYADL